MEQTWRPLHDGHSISEMSLTLELDRVLDQSTLAGVVDKKESFPGLPAMNVVRGVPFSMPGMPAQPWRMMNPLSQPPIAMVNFDRFTSTGTVAERLGVQGNAVGYVTTEYTRWAKVSSKAFGYLETVMPLLGDANIATLTLIYTDKFVSPRNSEEGVQLSSLLRQGGALVAPVVAAADEAAHSNIGFFKAVASMPSLVNVNLGIEDQQGVGRVAIILCFIRVQMTSAIECRDANFGMDGTLANVAREAHMLSKKLLHDVINDDIASRIGLTLP